MRLTLAGPNNGAAERGESIAPVPPIIRTAAAASRHCTDLEHGQRSMHQLITSAIRRGLSACDAQILEFTLTHGASRPIIHVRSAFISDLHLGSRECRADR